MNFSVAPDAGKHPPSRNASSGNYGTYLPLQAKLRVAGSVPKALPPRTGVELKVVPNAALASDTRTCFCWEIMSSRRRTLSTDPIGYRGPAARRLYRVYGVEALSAHKPNCMRWNVLSELSRLVRGGAPAPMFVPEVS